MFRIVQKRPGGEDIRLEADAVLTPADFDRIASEPGRRRLRARKIGFVAARQAAEPEVVETRWNGSETTNRARIGDWIVTSLDPQQQPLRDGGGHTNTYVVPAEGFADLYQLTGAQSGLGDVFRAKAVVDAIALPGGFDIVAPWGERQTAPSGYLLCNGTDVHGNHAETFEATYEQLRD
jgi:hypothetical protein